MLSYDPASATTLLEKAKTLGNCPMIKAKAQQLNQGFFSSKPICSTLPAPASSQQILFKM